MLGQDGSITFTSELVQIIDTFIAEYEAAQGPLRNDLERGLVISYVLGVMRCELESIWDSLAEAAVFGNLHPRMVFEDCAKKHGQAATLDRELVRDMLRKKGWLSD
jgi:hypothetical protein